MQVYYLQEIFIDLIQLIISSMGLYIGNCMIKIDWLLVFESFRYRIIWIIPVIVGTILLLLLKWGFNNSRYKQRITFCYSGSMCVIMIGLFCFFVEVSKFSYLIADTRSITYEMITTGFLFTMGPLISSFVFALIFFILSINTIRKL
jgi:uncharacterized membrane protein (DUF485 family)